MESNPVIEALNWRYATKKMNGQPVPQELVDQIIEAAWLAPTSSGLQPFEIIVVSNSELKQQMLPIANNQSQIVDASHVLIFAAWDTYTAERIDAVFGYTASERGLPADRFDDYKNRLKSVYLNRPDIENFNHTARQAYISLGTALTTAAALKVDATPMEGFNAAALDALLDLPSRGLKSVLMLPLGYRDESNDWLLPQKKVRRPKQEVISVIE